MSAYFAEHGLHPTACATLQDFLAAPERFCLAVAAVGDDVTKFKPGDHALLMAESAGFAEFAPFAKFMRKSGKSGCRRNWSLPMCENSTIEPSAGPGVPRRAARVGWWLRPDHGFNLRI